MKELYFAYGSNLNIAQMDNRCPLAQLVSRAVLEGYELAFRCGVLTILPKEGGRVDGILWKVNDRDERALDRYEGYPHLYTKETLTVQTVDTSILMNDAVGYHVMAGITCLLIMMLSVLEDDKHESPEEKEEDAA